MDLNAANPTFPRAIPHGTAIIDLLTQGVIFGPSPGRLRAVPWRGFQSPSGDIFGGVSRDIRKAFFRVRASFWSCVREQMKPKLGLDLEPKLGNSDLNENSNPDSNLTNRTPRQFEV